MDDSLPVAVNDFGREAIDAERIREQLLQVAQDNGIDVNTLGVVNRRNRAIGNAVGSVGVLAEVLIEEMNIWRANLRERGAHIRQYLGNLKLNLGIFWRPMLYFFAKNRPYKPICLEGNAALGREVSNYQELNESNVIMAYSLIDLVKILLNDDVESGVLRRFQLWSKPWDSLPIREQSKLEDEDTFSEFQLFNRPLTMDEDDDCMSNPSTMQSDANRILSLEAQLLKLSRQIAALTGPVPSNRSRAPSGNSNQKSPSGASVTSADEGVCMQSVRSQAISPAPALPSIMEKALPAVRPPPGPPPPLPPAPLLLLTPSRNGMPKRLAPRLDLENQQPGSPAKVNDAVSVGSCSSPGSIRLQDIQAVRLRKTTVAKSPGGTPLNIKPLRENQNMESGEFLATALRNKFRNVIPSVNEEDETNNSFNEDDWVDGTSSGDSITNHVDLEPVVECFEEVEVTRI